MRAFAFVHRALARRTGTSLAGIAVLFVLTVATFARPVLDRGFALFVSPSPAPAAQLDGGPPPTARPVLVIYLTRDGFAPDEIEAHPGARLFFIRNLSGIDELSFALAPAPGTSQPPEHAPIFAGRLGIAADASQEVVFAPGQVLDLTEQSHPDWHCHITVVP